MATLPGPAPDGNLTELTLRGVIIGALITVLFTASNVYLGLKVGLTFSSSIPAVVISFAVLRLFSNSGILENNMVQTQASAAGTLSSVIFALPAVLMVGYWQRFDFLETLLICASGGVLGVLFSIPLRRTMVANSDLPYPEGVAAAEILKAGYRTESQKGEGSAGDILFGGLLSALIALCTSGFQVLTDKAGFWFSHGKAVFQIPFGFSLALLSAGYLMGLTAGLAMVIGLVLGWGVFIPWLTSQSAATGSPMEIAMHVWQEQVRYIGTGTLVVAAFWTLITLFTPMLEGIKLSIKALRDASGGVSDRTDRDLSARSLIAALFAVCVVLALAFHGFVAKAPLSPLAGWGLVAFGVFMVFVIGFLVAAACGYMAGLVGSSNSPVSGIGIIGIILVSLALVGLDNSLHLFTGAEGRRFGMALAVFVATGVISVGAIANDNLQDLKTGQLVGATPASQQIALMIGCCVGAVVIAPTLGLLYEAYGFAGAAMPRPGMNPADMLSAPQATLMKTVAQGIFSHSLEWTMILLGVGVGTGIIALDALMGSLKSPVRLSALAVGLGMYLPPYVSSAIIVGSLLNPLVKRALRRKDARHGTRDAEHNKKGVLIAAGFIVGESLVGVLVAIAILASMAMGYGDAPLSMAASLSGVAGEHFDTMRTALSLLVFAGVCMLFFRKSS